MNLEQIIELANNIKVAYLGTLDEDQPRVRGMLMWKAVEDGFIFHTGKQKNLYKNLAENKKVEACFYHFNAENQMESIMLRVTGEVEFLEDIEMKKEIINERTFLQAYDMGEKYDDFIVFKIKNGEARVWKMENNLREDEIVPIKF